MRIETSVVVNRPIEKVWAFMTDPFNAPRWRSAVLELRPTSPGPLGVGSTGQVRVVILGFETKFNSVVTEWNPPNALAISGKGMGFRSVSFRETLEATAEGTKVVNVADVEPRGILKPLVWLLGPFQRHRIDAQTQNLKRLLEAEPG